MRRTTSPSSTRGTRPVSASVTRTPPSTGSTATCSPTRCRRRSCPPASSRWTSSGRTSRSRPAGSRWCSPASSSATHCATWAEVARPAVAPCSRWATSTAWCSSRWRPATASPSAGRSSARSLRRRLLCRRSPPAVATPPGCWWRASVSRGLAPRRARSSWPAGWGATRWPVAAPPTRPTAVAARRS